MEFDRAAGEDSHIAKEYGAATAGIVEALAVKWPPPRAVATCSLLLNAIRIIESQLPCAVRLPSHNVCGDAGPDLCLA